MLRYNLISCVRLYHDGPRKEFQLTLRRHDRAVAVRAVETQESLPIQRSSVLRDVLITDEIVRLRTGCARGGLAGSGNPSGRPSVLHRNNLAGNI